MTAYYNEFDPKAAWWLRELIKAGLIADGIVDERSILDVRPDELVGYTQCHFFAGIGGWSLALRLAGWPDDKPVWTGSCPCQPFSAAGKGAGFADERHLWPYWFHLIQHGKPRDVPVFGEQVASKDGLAWLDLVHADMEGEGYAVGAFDLCAAGVGAPHIRQRLWFVGHAIEQGLEGHGRDGDHGDESGRIDAQSDGSIAQAGATGRLADSECGSAERRRYDMGEAASGTQRETQERQRIRDESGTGVTTSGLADSDSHEQEGRPGEKSGAREEVWLRDGNDLFNGMRLDEPSESSPTNGLWRDADWLFCRDGKWRPVEPGTFPLADGLPGRVGLLRGYGNAIVPEVAAEVIGAYMEWTKA